MYVLWIYPQVPNDVLNMSPILQTVPQDVPNSNMVYPPIGTQDFPRIFFGGRGRVVGGGKF
jgi:hypothetical protein